MAFNPNKDKLKQSLNEKLSQPMIPPKKRKPGRPKGRTKFPLQVSLSNNQREKLERMAASAGFTSISPFLSDWIDKYEE
jgi:hypothetical protein